MPASAIAQQRRADPVDAALATEFPPYDFVLLGLQQRGRAAKAAAAARARAPDQPDTLARLLTPERT